MKKILYSVALAACCMSTMTSCSDFLDAENKSNVSISYSRRYSFVWGNPA